MGFQAHPSAQLISPAGRISQSERGLTAACHRIGERLLPLLYRRTTQIAIDCCVASLAVLLAYQFRFDFNVPPTYARGMWFWIAAMPILRSLAMLTISGYRSLWHLFGVQDLPELLQASMPPSLFLLSLQFAKPQTAWAADVPRGVIALELATFVGLAAGVRGLRRAIYEKTKPSLLGKKRALLLGSEDTLAPLLSQVRRIPELDLVGLIAPGRHLRGLRIAGVPIVAEPDQLNTLLHHGAIDAIVIADAGAHWTSRARSTAAEFGIDVHLVPSAANVMQGHVRVATAVDPDLALGAQRSPVKSTPRVLDIYRQRVVLVTGAGGSIGFELSRQVSQLGVSRLILLDHDENAVFEADHELKNAGAEVLPVVGDIRERPLLRHVFGQHKPDIVLHSAAFKHVPIMEPNASEAVLNNIIGTREVADAAAEFGSERFLLISSDKAVHPASVMGATKRVAEMLVQQRAAQSQGTRFACVRFGNVVGSQGSVIPIFLRQIAEGNAITITDKRMSRYFMTIKEAVSLVLQASSLASDGEIYVLDMGDPVKITDVAHSLVKMSGLIPEKDVPIKTIGIRPGEKLHEQLWYQDARVCPTEFPRVYSVTPEELPPDLDVRINELEQVARDRRNDEVIARLQALPIGYQRESHARIE